MKSYVVYFCATIACVMAMPQGPVLASYNNAMRVPIQMGETAVEMGGNMANTVDNLMSGNPFLFLGSFLPNGRITGRQSTAAQNGGNFLTQAQGMANGAMGLANNMAQQGTAAATNAMGQGMHAANNAMGLVGNMAQRGAAAATNAMSQGAQTAQNLFASTLQGFRFF